MAFPDYEDFRIAHQLLEKEQNRSYWECEKLPLRPLGRVFLEPLRQLIVFIVPISLVAWFAYQVNIYTMVTTVPLAFLIGYLLHRQLEWSINRKSDREHEIDRGRYHAIRTLSQKNSVPPSIFTLKLIEEWATAFVRETTRRAVEKQRLEALRATAKKRSAVQNNQLALGSNGAAMTAVAIETSYSDSIIDEPSRYHWEAESWTVNPGSGLPMAGSDGLGVDVGGNPFGTGH